MQGVSLVLKQCLQMFFFLSYSWWNARMRGALFVAWSIIIWKSWLISRQALVHSFSSFISILSNGSLSSSFNSNSIFSFSGYKDQFFSNFVCRSLRTFFMSNLFLFLCIYSIIDLRISTLLSMIFNTLPQSLHIPFTNLISFYSTLQKATNPCQLSLSLKTSFQ